MGANPKLFAFSNLCFWDAPRDQIDLAVQKNWLIVRIIEWGNWADWMELKEQFTLSEIDHAIHDSRIINKRNLHFWNWLCSVEYRQGADFHNAVRKERSEVQLEEPELTTESLEPQTAKELLRIGRFAASHGFTLVGGTALAMHLRHRMSIDLDFFKTESFEGQSVINLLADFATPSDRFSIKQVDSGTLHMEWNGVKVSFLRQAGSHLTHTVDFNGIKIAALKDIAAMKMLAVSSRGERKDFIDLYAIGQCGYSLQHMLDWTEERFPHYNKPHLLRSAIYFADAEQSAMPTMLVDYQWDDIKSFFTEQVRDIMQNGE